MNKLKIFLLTPVILLYTLCGYSTTNRWAPAVAGALRLNASPAAANTVSYAVTFTEPVTGVTTASFSVATFLGLTGASVASVSGSGTTWLVTVNTGTGDGNLRLLVTGAGISPAVINAPYSGGAIYSIDKTPPAGSVTINTGAASTNNANVTLDIAGTDLGGSVQMRFSADNLTWTPYEALAATKSFTLPPGGGVKTVYMQLLDAAGNSITFTDNIILDQTPPAISSVSLPNNGFYGRGRTIHFSVYYNENINVNTTGGVPYIELNIGGVIRHASFSGMSGARTLNFNYSIGDGEIDLDGITMANSIILNGGIINDGVNDAPLVLNVTSLPNVKVYGIYVVPVLSSTAGPSVNGPFTVTFTFNQPVTNFTLPDITVYNAGQGDLQTSDNITWTALITPSPGATSISVQLQSGAVGGFGLANSNISSNVLYFQYDIIAPAINSVTKPVTGNYHLYSPLVFTVTYSENVIVTGTPHIAIQIGNPTDRIASYISGSGTNTLTFTYDVEEGLLANDISISPAIALNGGKITDAAGNNAPLLLQNISAGIINVDSRRPTVAFTTTAPGIVTGPFPVTVTFSEAVTGFALADMNQINVASLSNLQTTDNITYTFTVTPAANGPVELELTSDKVYNARLNGNASSNKIIVNYDNVPPVVTAVGVPTPKYYKTGEVLDFTVAFNENVTVTGVPHIELLIGTAQVRAEYVSGSGNNVLTFRYTIVSTDIDEDGIAVGTPLVVNGGTVKDAAGNNAAPVLNSVGNTSGVYVYSKVPSVIITTAAGTLVNAPFGIQIQFSDVPNSFNQSNITVTNATVGFLSTGIASYTLLVTPLADGPVTISVAANAVVNKAGTGNTASNTLNLTYDGTGPVITSVGVPANGYYKANSTLTFTVNTSEVIQGTGIPSLDVIIGAAARQATYVSGLGTNALTFSYVVQDGEIDMDGIALGANLLPNGATLKDVAGNNMVYTLQNAGNTQHVFVNTSHPTVVLSAVTVRVNGPYAVTITFSEAVTGFAATDLTVTNGTAGNLQTTDNITYTALITPTVQGTVTVQLPADQVVNIGANGNTASNTLTNTYERNPPVITAAQTFNAMERDPAGTTVGTITATAVAGTLQNWAIATDPTGGAFEISANGTITVKDVALLNSKAGTTVTLNITVSDGLNTSAPATVAVVIKAVNKAPAFDQVTDKEICITTATQTFAVTGATATEAGQTFGFTISADQPFFDALTIDAAGLVSYKLKATATGKANITIVIIDNGGTVNGGVDVFQRTFALSINSLPVVSISSNKGTTVSKGDAVVLTASGAATYSWGTATGPVFTVTPQANITYNVTGVNAAGCPGTAQITINTIEDFKVDAINILTPNGDGINDKWVIRNINSYPDNELKIFDRSGRIVYQRRNYSNDWDGTMNGRRLTEGTYYYILTIDGSNKTVKGYITLISDQK